VKHRFSFVIFLFLAGCFQLHATTWQVGPSYTYTMPSQVSTLVQDGDTVLIDAGVYNSDVAKWTANNLLLKGKGGRAHLKANGNSYGGKAIWVIAGNNTTVDSIEFSLCSVPDHNGAGIRQEGIHLTVQHCYFHDNEEGILAGDNITSNIVIEHTEFENNGYGDGYSHNLYINHVYSLLFRYNYSHRAHVGHELKSRAYNNYILYNRIANESGDASREIDLPNGGLAFIIGNEIEQGVSGQNSNIIGYGAEGLTNPGAHELYVINNTVVNNKTVGSFVSVQSGTALYKSYNNLFAGGGNALSGSALAYDTSNNIRCTIAAAGMVNASAYDYHLLPTSVAINGGTNPGFANSFYLVPVNEYVHPTDGLNRIAVGQIDVGAHEYQTLADISSDVAMNSGFFLYPNPSDGNFTLYINKNLTSGICKIQIFNLTGRIVYTDKIVNRNSYIVNGNFSPGVYFVRIDNGTYSAVQKLIVQ
jgi:hypothetical protein